MRVSINLFGPSRAASFDSSVLDSGAIAEQVLIRLS